MCVYAANKGIPQYIKQTFTNMKGETDSDTRAIGYFSTLFTSRERSHRQKISKGNTDLKWHFGLDELTGYTKNISSKGNRIHMHVHKEHSPGQTNARPQKKPQ